MKRSRRWDLILSTVSRDFIRAVAEGFGVVVAVTYRELLISKGGLFCRPVLRRFSLGDIDSIELRSGRNASRLVVQARGRPPATMTVLYGTGAAADFANVVAAVGRLRCRGRDAHRRPVRRRGRELRRYGDRQPSTSAIP